MAKLLKKKGKKNIEENIPEKRYDKSKVSPELLAEFENLSEQIESEDKNDLLSEEQVKHNTKVFIREAVYNGNEWIESIEKKKKFKKNWFDKFIEFILSW